MVTEKRVSLSMYDTSNFSTSHTNNFSMLFSMSLLFQHTPVQSPISVTYLLEAIKLHYYSLAKQQDKGVETCR